MLYWEEVSEYKAWFKRSFKPLPAVLSPEDFCNADYSPVDLINTVRNYSTLRIEAVSTLRDVLATHPLLTRTMAQSISITPRWCLYNINAACLDINYIVEWNGWWLAKNKTVSIRGNYHIICKNTVSVKINVISNVQPEWGEYSPHNVRNMMSIKTLRWKYTSDVKFDF